MLFCFQTDFDPTVSDLGIDLSGGRDNPAMGSVYVSSLQKGSYFQVKMKQIKYI